MVADIYLRGNCRVCLLLSVYFQLVLSQSCNLNTTTARVTCSTKLANFPTGLPSNSKGVAILGTARNENSIPVLQKSDFDKFSNLEDLAVTYSGVSKLDSDVFSGNNKLRHLYLSYNNIDAIPANIFRSTGKLETLDLTGNDGCKISPDAFHALKKLRRLYLGDLGLSVLPDGLFRGLSSLVDLDLHGNRLTTLPLVILKSLPNLNILDISFNEIEVLPETFLPILKNFQQVDLSDNPWRCICDNSWMKKLNSSFVYSTASGNIPVCTAPYRLRYREILRVNDKDMECIPPKVIQCHEPYHVKEGELLQVSCKVEGHIFPNITWVKPDRTLIPFSGIPFSDPSYKTVAEVSVPAHAADASDNGKWSVRAENDKTIDVYDFDVHVELHTTTTTPTMTTNPIIVSSALPTAGGLFLSLDSDIGFIIAAGGFAATLVIGTIVVCCVWRCYKKKKNKIEDSGRSKRNALQEADDVTFIVAPVSD